ncbi:conserved protein of unknown function [Pseudomonas marincola]|uniref:Uncharacterized protein n=1 Tax=Pseudomonas marincola TaxID=437900 RepID=A0A653E6U1_9PSED|nr:conserved protein of unknown function [Pseudomonas marincola]
MLDVNCAFESRCALYSLRSRRFSAIFPPQEEQGATGFIGFSNLGYGLRSRLLASS